ncbi:MAG: hypothetical protein IPJ39_17430 [Saprospiraceae bacterium]|nr:hypothetical protein [Saprospiraceae bacterium]
MGEWNFNSNTVNCNGVVSNRIAQYDLYTPRFGAVFGNLEYCPNTNNGCGQTKLGSKGHVNTNDFYYAICLANFWNPTFATDIGGPNFDVNDPTWNPQHPANFYVYYKFPINKVGSLTSFHSCYNPSKIQPLYLLKNKVSLYIGMAP